MSAYSSVILATGGLACYWRLGEPSGTNANDETANNNDGTYTSCTLGVAGALNSDPDTAVSVGASGKIEVPDIAAMPQSDSDCTIELWIYPTAMDAYAAVIDTTNRAFALFLNAAGSMSSAFGGFASGDNSLSLSQAFTFSEWQMVHFIRRSTAVELWRNATQIGTGTISGSATLSSPLTFGTNPSGGGGRYTGAYDEIAAYTVALDSTTIAAHYAAGIAAAAPTLYVTRSNVRTR